MIGAPEVKLFFLLVVALVVAGLILAAILRRKP